MNKEITLSLVLFLVGLLIIIFSPNLTTFLTGVIIILWGFVILRIHQKQRKRLEFLTKLMYDLQKEEKING